MEELCVVLVQVIWRIELRVVGKTGGRELD